MTTLARLKSNVVEWLDGDDGGAYEAFRARRRFTGLDGLRGVGVLLVIRQHVMNPTDRFGYGGLVMFFAISGFLITTLLLRERTATGDISLRMFYVRRTLRIFPIYYAILLTYVALTLVMERHTVVGREFFGNLPWFATYTSNWLVDGVGGDRVIFYFSWSLATEEQFYLLWPSVVRLTGSRMALVGVMSLVALGAAFAAGFVTGAPSHALGTAAPICIGCVLALLADDPRGFRAVHAIVGQWWSLPAFFMAALLGIVLDAPTPLLGTLMALVVAALCLPRRVPLALPIARGPLPTIGLVSYGMYLMHMLTTNAVVRTVPLPQRSLAQFAVVALATTAVATLSYRTYERWFLRFKERFRPTRRAPDVTRVAVAPAPSAESTPEAIGAP